MKIAFLNGFLILALLFAGISPTHALTVEKITFADRVLLGGVTLDLHNAALLRYLIFMKAYVAALYLP